jgi:hypothetical protein
LSDRACYIQRTDRGAAIVRARLLSERSDESWTAGPSVNADAAELAAEDAARWIRDRLAETRTPKRLDTLCLDLDGAVCSWVKGRDADADLIRSAVEGADTSANDADDGLDPAQTPGIADRLPRLPMEVSYDLLVSGEPTDRAGVLAAPDAPARLLLDRIDHAGVRVERVITLWHALAEAWDPGARQSHAPSRTQSGNASPTIVASDHPPAAVVAIDHDAARLVWTWSRTGVLLACGSIRLKRDRHSHQANLQPNPQANPQANSQPDGPRVVQPGPVAEVHEHDIARLAADWLGWSAQIGICPTRVIVVGQPGPRGMTAGEIGTGLTRAWPGALTDLVGCDDAVAETLRRTLDARHINAFAPLTERPTRTHRSAYRWTALALVVVGVGVGVMAAKFFARAASTRDQLATIRQERTEILTAVDPGLVMDPFPLAAIDAQINAIERRTGTVAEENPRPILTELDTLSFVLAMPDVTVQSIQITDTLVSIQARLSGARAAEELDQALRAVGPSQLRWNPPSIASGAGGQVVATYSAMWPQQRAAR